MQTTVHCVFFFHVLVADIASSINNTELAYLVYSYSLQF